MGQRKLFIILVLKKKTEIDVYGVYSMCHAFLKLFFFVSFVGFIVAPTNADIIIKIPFFSNLFRFVTETMTIKRKVYV